MSNKRFEEVYSQGTIDVMRIIIDKQTGVQYLQTQSGYSGGLTVLVDANGKPITGDLATIS